MSPEGSERKSRGRGSRVPRRAWEPVMDSLLIPRDVLDRTGSAESIVMFGERQVFVEYPSWWRDYNVCGGEPGEKHSLLEFVLANAYPDLGKHGLETVYLDAIDLSRIPLDRLTGLRVEKIALLR